MVIYIAINIIIAFSYFAWLRPWVFPYYYTEFLNFFRDPIYWRPVIKAIENSNMPVWAGWALFIVLIAEGSAHRVRRSRAVRDDDPAILAGDPERERAALARPRIVEGLTTMSCKSVRSAPPTVTSKPAPSSTTSKKTAAPSSLTRTSNST